MTTQLMTMSSMMAITCIHKNIAVFCYLCKKGGVCLHGKRITRCVCCRFSDMYKTVKICLSADCTNHAADNYFGDYCSECYSNMYPEDVRTMNFRILNEFVEHKLVKLNIFTDFRVYIIDHEHDGQKMSFRVLVHNSVTLIIRVEKYKMIDYDREKIYVFLYSMLQEHKDKIISNILYIRLNSGECMVDHTSLKTSILYNGYPLVSVMKPFWKVNPLTGELEPGEDLQVNLESYLTRITGVGLLIDSFVRVPPKVIITIRELYF